MFINKAKNGKNNICGENIFFLRKNLNISQKKLADMLQLQGLDVDKNAIQRIEAGKRFVTDIELLSFSKIFNVDINKLLENILI
ncbi:helix-turn-helix transcriptional regulator [bacterium]|nr:helix-turn-helix transcriptional regulator [bacterium]